MDSSLITISAVSYWVEVPIGETETLKLRVPTENRHVYTILDLDSFEWSCEPDGFVSVENGVVTGLAEGTAYVYAKLGEMKVEFSVTAYAPEEPEPGITEEPEITPEPGTTEEPEITPEPGTTEEPEVTPEPGTTEEPEVTPEPGTTEEPEVTPEPGTTEEPKVTPELGTTEESEVKLEPQENKPPVLTETKATIKNVKLKKQKKALILTWKKKTSSDMYVIQVATSKAFKKKDVYKVKSTVKRKKIKKFRGKKLKKGKIYYVRIASIKKGKRSTAWFTKKIRF